MKPLALVLAIVFLALAVCCFTGALSILPAVGLDGHQHVKHAIVYLVLAILCLLWMRMAGGTTANR